MSYLVQVGRPKPEMEIMEMAKGWQKMGYYCELERYGNTFGEKTGEKIYVLKVATMSSEPVIEEAEQ